MGLENYLALCVLCDCPAIELVTNKSLISSTLSFVNDPFSSFDGSLGSQPLRGYSRLVLTCRILGLLF